MYGAEAILAHALAHPTHGAQRVADELMLRGVQVSSGGVRGVWIRNGLITYTGTARTAAAAWRGGRRTKRSRKGFGSPGAGRSQPRGT